MSSDEQDAFVTEGPPSRLATFASLSNANYRKFFAGQVVSLTGTWMQSVALSWLVLQLTHSATWLGVAVALQTLPVLLLGPYGGVVVDRAVKRRLLVVTQSAAAVQAFVLGLLTVTAVITLPIVLALSLVLGLITVFDNPARQAFVREMVPDGLVRNAVSLNSVLVNVSRAVGPAIGGLIIAKWGVGVCFLVNAVSFTAVISAYLLMDRDALFATTPSPRAPGQLRAGLQYVRRTPRLLVPLVMMLLIGMLTYEFGVTLPALSTQTFHAGAQGFGFITAAMGMGAVVGGLISAGRRAIGTAPMAVAATAFGSAVLLVAVTPTMRAAAGALFLVGAASVWFLSLGNATLQMRANADMRGRVMALWSVAFLGTTPIGGPIIGHVAEHQGARWALAVGAIAALGAAVLGWTAVIRIRRSSADEARPTGRH